MKGAGSWDKEHGDVQRTEGWGAKRLSKSLRSLGPHLKLRRALAPWLH